MESHKAQQEETLMPERVQDIVEAGEKFRKKADAAVAGMGPKTKKKNSKYYKKCMRNMRREGGRR